MGNKGLSHKQLILLSLTGSLALVQFGLASNLASTTVKQYAAAFVILFGVLELARLVYNVLIYPKLLSPLRDLPGPPGGNFFTGQWGRIYRGNSGEPQREWVATVPNDGIIRYLGILNNERLMPTNSKTLAEVLTSKSYVYTKPSQIVYNVGKLLGIGILLAEGDEHKRQRKILVPAFHNKHLRSISRHFWEKSQLLCRVLTEKMAKDNSAIDVDEWASRVTLDIIGKAGFALEFNAIEDENSKMNQTYRQIFKPSKVALVMAFIGTVVPQRIMFNLPFQRNLDLKSSINTIKGVCREMIKDTHRLFSEKKEVDRDILSVMIEDGQMSDEDIVEQLMTFLAAGHETTSAAVTWCLYALAKDPELQTRLRNDIRAAIPSLDEPSVTPETIESIRQLRNVCNETLRYYPPVHITLRSAAEDTTLGGRFIPKGTMVIISPMAINRSAEFWGPDANEFVPDRWDKEGGAGGAKSNYANLTFLMGPRSCIGQKFAQTEFLYIMAALVGRFSFEIDDPEREVKMISFLTVRPLDGLPMKVKRVPGW